MNSKLRREQEKIEWVTMNMRLSGSPVSEETAAKIAAGDYVLDATLEEHLLVTRLTEILPQMQAMADMQEELSCGTLHRFYETLSGGEAAEYRRSTPVLFHLSHSPVLPQEIEEELRELFRTLHGRPAEDPLATAVRTHNEIIRIYPYSRYSELTARAAMEYELKYQGLSMIPLTLTERQYNTALAEYMKKGSESAILENLKLNRLMADSAE